MGRTFGTLERAVDTLLLTFEVNEFEITGFDFVEDNSDEDTEEVHPLLDGMSPPPAGFYLLHEGKLYSDVPDVIETDVIDAKDSTLLLPDSQNEHD